MKKVLIFSGCLFLYSVLLAQQTGEVVFKSLGLSFSIPDAWQGQEGDGVYIMVSQSKAGFVLLSTHTSNSLQELQQEARQGLQEGQSTILNMIGEFEQVTQNGLGCEFGGILEGQQAKAYFVGMLNPLGGQGVTIMAATSSEVYDASYSQLAKQVAESVSFFKAEIPPIVDEWKQTLQNCRLTYMDSYYSSGPSYDGYSTGGGYETKTIIELCSRGYFNHSHASSMSVDTGGAFGNSHNNSGGAGTWQVIGNAAGQPVLQLNFHSGEVYEYTLSYEEEKTYLNGDRYFRTYDGEYAPNCH